MSCLVMPHAPRVHQSTRWVSRHAAAMLFTLALTGAIACHDDATPRGGITAPGGEQSARSPSVQRAAPSPWRVVPSPNQGSLANDLKGLTILSANDVWAVGEWNPGLPPTATGRRTLTEHWNGASWQVVASPNATWSGVDLSTLEDVAAVSSSDIWAVGHADDFATLRSTTLIVHWDGAQWTIVPSPDPAGPNLPNQLYGVVALSATDIWAVGVRGASSGALILHWNGASWSDVPNGCSGPLRGITAVSAQRLWAVGDAAACTYDGQRWTPVQPAQPAYFQDVAAVSATLVWSVGRQIFCPGESCYSSSVIERWDGVRWTAVPHPVISTLNGIAAASATDAWAVGDDATRAVILHWDGSAWTRVALPGSGTRSSSLNDVATLATATSWAVGHYFDNNAQLRTATIRR